MTLRYWGAMSLLIGLLLGPQVPTYKTAFPQCALGWLLGQAGKAKAGHLSSIASISLPSD